MGPVTIVENCFGYLKLYSDGSISRSSNIHFVTRRLEDNTVVHKSLLFDEEHNLNLSLYKPKSNPSSSKLPIVFHFHGGGFCFGSRTYPHNHNIGLRLATVLQALIIEPDYRLAPEHRLPAALDDACYALKWLQGQAMHVENMDTWFDGVDFDRVFVLGYSSGGNLAHHLAVQFGAGSIELAPVRVRGYVLLSPFFGGCVKTGSEEERPFEGFWNLEMYHRFWRLSVPIGSTQDHPVVNPFGPLSPSLAEVALDPILVVVGGDEILRERVEDYAKKMKELGKEIEYVELEGEQHGYFIDAPLSATSEKVIQTIKLFMSHKKIVEGWSFDDLKETINREEAAKQRSQPLPRQHIWATARK